MKASHGPTRRPNPSLELRCTVLKTGCHHRDDTCKYGCNKEDLACASRNSSIRQAGTTPTGSVAGNETQRGPRPLGPTQSGLPQSGIAVDWDEAAARDSTATRLEMGLGIE